MSAQYEKIIIRMPNWVGDLVMATPLLTDIRQQFPKAEITVMCQSGLATLLRHDRDVDGLFTFAPSSGWQKRDARRALMDQLRAGNYDLGILTTNSFSSAWWFCLGGVKKRIGFRGDWRRPLLTQPVVFPKQREQQHLVHTYKSLLEPLGIPISDTMPRLHLLDEELAEARALLEKHGVPRDATLVGINPGAAYGSAKCWLPERFTQVTQKLIEDPTVYVVYFGDSSQVQLVKRICGQVPERVLNLAGATSLRELVALMSLCNAVLTNDSGPMHIAAALGIPLLALFGSTNEIKTGPYGQRDGVIHKHAACSPCYLRSCPIDFRCMKQIGTDEVFHRLQRLLGVI